MQGELFHHQPCYRTFPILWYTVYTAVMTVAEVDDGREQGVCVFNSSRAFVCHVDGRTPVEGPN